MKSSHILRFLLGVLLAAGFSTGAFGQASRTWVSGVGDDANPCSRTAPCKTFAGAISKTAVNGEINALDPAGYGAVTITKSITIDAHEIFASILNAGTNGVNIPFDNFTAVGETRKTVRLRNINFNGFDSGLISVSISGGAGSNNSKVYIEDCLMDGNFGGTARGIFDNRSGTGGVLAVNNTTIRNMNSTGISVPAAGALNIVISHSRVLFCDFGFAAGGGAHKAQLYDCVFSSNKSNGVRTDGPAGSQISVDHSVVSNNLGAGFVAGGGGAILVSHTTAINNNGLSVGTVSSYGNNQTGGTSFSGGAVGPN